MSDAGEGINIVARICDLLLEHLGARIGRRQSIEHFDIAAILVMGQETRDAEIDHLDIVGRGDDDVAGLEVAVHDARAMREFEGIGDAGDDSIGVLPRVAVVIRAGQSSFATTRRIEYSIVMNTVSSSRSMSITRTMFGWLRLCSLGLRARVPAWSPR